MSCTFSTELPAGQREEGISSVQELLCEPKVIRGVQEEECLSGSEDQVMSEQMYFLSNENIA